MGKAAVQVANSLDHAVEHLFEGWSVSPPAEKRACSSIEEQVCRGTTVHSSLACSTMSGCKHFTLTLQEQQKSNRPEKDRRPAVMNGASSTGQSETRQQKQQRIRKLRCALLYTCWHQYHQCLFSAFDY